MAELYGWGPLDRMDGDREGLERLLNSTLLEEGHGPTVTFNLLRPDGSYVGYEEVGPFHNLLLT